MFEELFQSQSIAEEKLFNGVVFPLTVFAENGNKEVLLQFIEKNKDLIDEKLLLHGGLLFRGFGLQNHLDFHDVAEALSYKEMKYVGGAAVRTQLTSRVFTANESPSSENIPFHHELAQTPNPPTHIMFFCETPPCEGGETPIVPSTVVFDMLNKKHPNFMEKLENLGVRYIRRLSELDDATSAIGRGWKSTFLCDNKADAEAALSALGSTWEWEEGGVLKTISATVPAIRVDAGEGRTNRKVFFNSVVAAYTGWNDSRNVGTKAVVTGDGEYLDEAVMADAVAIMNENAVAFRWQQGDVLLLDNRTVMHSRRPFTGPRRILASLARDPER